MDYITEPLPHQKIAFETMKDVDSYILSWDVGTGKTKPVIDVIRHHFIENRIENVLIICPLSAVFNWEKEFEKHSRLSPKVSLLVGTKINRLKALHNNSKKIFIINFAGLRTLEKELLKKPFGMIICDEIHNIKNFKAQQTQIAWALGDKADRKFGLSGTIILNNMLDLYGPVRFVDSGERFGVNYYKFIRTYFEDLNAHMPRNRYFPNWQPKQNAVGELTAKTKDLISVKRKEECLKLPPQDFQINYIEMTPVQTKAYEEMTKEMITFIENEPAVAKTALTKNMRLNQIIQGFIKNDSGGINRFAHNPKLSALKELLEDLQDRKVIVWCHFTEDVKVICETLHKQKINFVSIYGGTSNEDRQKAMDSFQNGLARVLVANMQAAGEALTFTASDYAIYYGLNYSRKDYVQSQGRNHRKGSEIHEKITYLHLIMKNTVDEVILQALKNKEDLAQAVLNHLKGGNHGKNN